MIDLHMHSTYSDGDKSVTKLLTLCEEKSLEYISLTDHNTMKQYSDKAINEGLFSGKIIKGVELSADFKTKKIEVLGYNIKKTEIIDTWAEQYFSIEIHQQEQEEAKKRLFAICDKKGLVYEEDKIKKLASPKDFVSTYIYNELMRHEKNHAILGEFTQSASYFIRKGIMDPSSEYYLCASKTPKPSYKEVVDIIHKAGGLAFLAHPFEYRFDNTLGFMDALMAENKLDGIECFHPSADEEQRAVLEEYARAHTFYISGGSDYHGSKKQGVQLGVGRGDLNISKKYLEEWVEV
ncbi:MAG: PHP domain-containing protein [Alphaproteobacteria bacterium]|nr:PHP domain-containing protein [Alphaproteobacteria bacterium]